MGELVGSASAWGNVIQEGGVTARGRRKFRQGQEHTQKPAGRSCLERVACSCFPWLVLSCPCGPSRLQEVAELLLGSSLQGLSGAPSRKGEKALPRNGLHRRAHRAGPRPWDGCCFLGEGRAPGQGQGRSSSKHLLRWWAGRRTGQDQASCSPGGVGMSQAPSLSCCWSSSSTCHTQPSMFWHPMQFSRRDSWLVLMLLLPPGSSHILALLQQEGGDLLGGFNCSLVGKGPPSCARQLVNNYPNELLWGHSRHQARCLKLSLLLAEEGCSQVRLRRKLN